MVDDSLLPKWSHANSLHVLTCTVHPVAVCCVARRLGYYTLGCGNNSSSSTAQCTPPSAAPSVSPFAAHQPAAAAAGQGLDSNPLQDAVSFGGSSVATPVLFLHGVGGLLPYLEMLRHVIGLGHPVVLVECKHVSLRLW
jgi:hypothetical protein